MVFVGTPAGVFPKQGTTMEFVVNSAVQVRTENEKMYLKRPNGQEFPTKLITRIAAPTP